MRSCASSGLLDQQRELIPADARQGVRAAHASAQVVRDLAKHRVAGIVSERVVDDLEAIQVEEQHRRRGAGALCASERLVQLVIEEQAIRETRQIIMVGQMPDSFGCLAAFDGDAGQLGADPDQLCIHLGQLGIEPLVQRQRAEKLILAAEDGHAH